MSLDAHRWAWKQKGIRPTDKLVLLSMSDRVAEDMTCFPSIARLMEDTGLNRKTIIAVWGRLQAAGLICDTGKRTGRTKQVIVWQLSGVEKRERTVPKTEQFQKRDRSQNYHETVPKTDRERSQKRDPESTKESTKEPTKRDKRTRKSKFSRDDLVQRYGVPPDVAAEYLEVRKAKRAPLTPSAMDTLVREFSKAGLTVPDGIRLCAAKSWQGFKAIWDWQEDAIAVLGNDGAGTQAAPKRPKEFPG